MKFHTTSPALRASLAALAITIAAPAAFAQSEAPVDDGETQTEQTQSEATETQTNARDPEIEVRGVAEGGGEITDRNHPDYVRCRSERVMGSLAQRKRTCMTNREWRQVADVGNRRANELVEEMRANATNGN